MVKVFKTVILILILEIILVLTNNWFKEKEIIAKSYTVNLTTENIVVEDIIKEPVWEETQEGYDVIAKLEIPKIDLKTNVLSRYTEDAMLVSVTKFWGAEPNNVGNFCIIGHNYFKRENMFYKLKNLKVGDEIYLTDTSNLRLTYEVYSITKVEPNDISCLSQNTNGKREITLITCTSDSKKRIIVKAIETEDF